MSDEAPRLDVWSTPPPETLLCVRCRYEVEPDDVAVVLTHTVLCIRCKAEIEGTEERMPKKLREEVQRTANGAT